MPHAQFRAWPASVEAEHGLRRLADGNRQGFGAQRMRYRSGPGRPHENARPERRDAAQKTPPLQHDSRSVRLRTRIVHFINQNLSFDVSGDQRIPNHKRRRPAEAKGAGQLH